MAEKYSVSELSSEKKGPGQRFKYRWSPSNPIGPSTAAFMIAAKLTKLLSSSLESLDRSCPCSGKGCGCDGPPTQFGSKVSSVDASQSRELTLGRLPLRSPLWRMDFKIPNTYFNPEFELRQIKLKDTKAEVTLPLR